MACSKVFGAMEPVDLGSPRHEAFGAILPFMNETIDGGDVEKEQKDVLLYLDSDIRDAFAAQVAKATKAVHISHTLLKFRRELLHLKVPPSTGVSIEQAMKDCKREKIWFNGQRFNGDGDKLLDHLKEAVNAFVKEKDAISSYAENILKAASRTMSGADSYFAISSLLTKPGFLVKPASAAKFQRPILISLVAKAGRATVSIESVNTYLMQNMDEQKKGKHPTWACIAATVTDQIDFMTQHKTREMRIVEVHNQKRRSEMDPAWALFESAARIDDDCDIAGDKGGSKDYDFPEKIIVSCAGVTGANGKYRRLQKKKEKSGPTYRMKIESSGNSGDQKQYFLIQLKCISMCGHGDYARLCWVLQQNEQVLYLHPVPDTVPPPPAGWIPFGKGVLPPPIVEGSKTVKQGKGMRSPSRYKSRSRKSSGSFTPAAEEAVAAQEAQSDDLMNNMLMPSLENEKVLQPNEAVHQWIGPEPDAIDPFLFAREEVFLNTPPQPPSELTPEAAPDAYNSYVEIGSDSSASMYSPKSDSKAVSPTVMNKNLSRSNRMSASAPELSIRSAEPIDLSEWGLSPRVDKDKEEKKESPKDLFADFAAPPPPAGPPPLIPTPSTPALPSSNTSPLSSLNLSLVFGNESSKEHGTALDNEDVFGPGTNTSASASTELILSPPPTKPRVARSSTVGHAPSRRPATRIFGNRFVNAARENTYPPRQNRGSVIMKTEGRPPVRWIETARENAKQKRASDSDARARNMFGESQASKKTMTKRDPLTEDEKQLLRTAQQNLKCRLASPGGQKILKDHAKLFNGDLVTALDNLLQDLEDKFRVRVHKHKMMRRQRKAAKTAQKALRARQSQPAAQTQSRQSQVVAQTKTPAHPHPPRQPQKATQSQSIRQTQTTQQPVRPARTMRQPVRPAQQTNRMPVRPTQQMMGQPIRPAQQTNRMPVRPTQQMIGQPVRRSQTMSPPTQTMGQLVRPPQNVKLSPQLIGQSTRPPRPPLRTHSKGHQRGRAQTAGQQVRPAPTMRQSITSSQSMGSPKRFSPQKPMHIKTRAPPPKIPDIKPFMGIRSRSTSAQPFGSSPPRNPNMVGAARRKQNRSVGDDSDLFNPFTDPQMHARSTPSPSFASAFDDSRPRSQTHSGTTSSVLLSEWDDDLQNAFD